MQLWEDLIYEEQHVEILDLKEKKFYKKMVPLIKVLWANHTIIKAGCEPKEEL